MRPDADGMITFNTPKLLKLRNVNGNLTEVNVCFFSDTYEFALYHLS